VPNLFFAAVHFLLLQGAQHPLKDYYPSLGGEKRNISKAFPHFRDFYIENQAALMPLLKTRRVQTNEVRRSAFLFPAFSYVSKLVKGKPIALLEIGPSAGFNLNWDKYAYVYNGIIHRGNTQSRVKLACTLKGSKNPPIPEVFPQVASRLGLELSPVSLDNAEERYWLQALIWPEHVDRIELLRRAIKVWEEQPQTMIAGDATKTLPKAIFEIEKRHPVVVYSSLALYQFSAQQKDSFYKILSDSAHDRRLFHISAEWDGVKQVEIKLSDYANNVSTHLANSEAHGSSLRWLAD